MLEWFFISPNNIYFWFTFAFLCIIFELVNPGLFYFLSFGIASLGVAMGVMVVPCSFVLQCSLFMIIFLLSFFVLKIFVRDTLNEQKNQYRSHLSALIAKEGVVVFKITKDVPGQVRIKNEVWLAYPHNVAEILVGQRIVVISVSGAHLVVKSI